MNLKLSMELDNSAFETGNDQTRSGSEIARILRAQADLMEHGNVAVGDVMSLRDANGNRVGNWTVED